MNTTIPSLAEYNLNDVVNKVTTYIFPVIITLIVISNITNIGVLTRRTLRSSSCTHYFLALASASLIYMISSPMNLYLRNRFGVFFSASPVGCRLSSFSIYSTALFVTLMLVCASVDRFFASSCSVRLRNFSEVRVAQKVIIIVAILTIIYMSPFFIIYHWDYTTNQCSQSSTTLIVVYFSSRIVLYYMVGPLAMITFGLLTIYNIQSQTSRVGPVAINAARQNHHRRTEGQLARMLIIQVGAYVIFSIPAAITYTLITFVPSANTPLINGLRTISIIWQQGIYILSFFLHILSAQVYRQELKKLFKLCHYRGQAVRQINQNTLARSHLNNQTNTLV